MEGTGPRQEVGLETEEDPGDRCDGEDIGRGRHGRPTGSQEGLEHAGTWWPRVEHHMHPNVLRSHLNSLCSFPRMT